MTNNRQAPIELGGEEFRTIGYRLIDDLAAFLDTIRERPVTPGESPKQLQQIIGNAPLPEHGRPAAALLAEATDLLLDHSLLNGHPKFHGYITSSPAPVGALADLLAATINPNVGAQVLSPIATEIEKQTIKWLAGLIGLTAAWDGIFVSGGNMANFTAFLAARTAKTSRNIKEDGLQGSKTRYTVYCSATTHTWIEKAVVLFGLGSGSVRWIRTDKENKMDNAALEQAIQDDLQKGHAPFMVIGTAGDVSTGVVDDLRGIAQVCKKYDLWFHVDGAYGVPAAALPECSALFDGLAEADSIALDPHKWLYAPLEAGCTLLKNPVHLIDTFSSHPVYYNFDNNDEVRTHNYYEYGLQNSRGFRALKVWLALQQVGRNGYIQMIRDDIELSALLFRLAGEHPELEAVTRNLSIATLRYIPAGMLPGQGDNESYINKLNEALLNELQQGGELFLSNALVRGKYCLRSCIVNFRTTEKDIEEMAGIIVRKGREVHQQLGPV